MPVMDTYTCMNIVENVIVLWAGWRGRFAENAISQIAVIEIEM